MDGKCIQFAGKDASRHRNEQDLLEEAGLGVTGVLLSWHGEVLRHAPELKGWISGVTEVQNMRMRRIHFCNL